MTQQLGRVIVGQNEVLKQVLIALFCQGHCILEGVPGLAKTLMISSIAQLLSLNFKPHPVHARPDAVGHHRHGNPRRGRRHRPAADAVRQGADLRQHHPRRRDQPHAAQDPGRLAPGHAGVQGHDGRRRTYPLEKPFLVLGTQNPIEQEGTYPLPEAQLDRFMFKVLIDYPSYEEELTIAEIDHGRRPAEDRAGAGPRRHPRHPADGAQGADRPLGDGLRRQAGAGHAAGLGRGAGLRQEVPDRGAPARAPARRCCWAARPTPCSTAGSTSPPTTSAMSPGPCCGTGWRPASGRRATA